MKILREKIINEDHHRNPGDDSKMAKIQLKSLQDNVAELLDIIQDNTQLDAWVQSLISKAQDDISAVRDYMVYGEDEEGGAPEIITDLPPMDVAPEAPVPLNVPDVKIDSEDELEMDDLMGPGPEVAGEEGDLPGAMEPAEAIPLDLEDEEEMEEMVEYGDEHPAGEWQRQEADRRWQRDEEGMYDPDDELENPEDYMDEDYMMESLETFGEKVNEGMDSYNDKDKKYTIELDTAVGVVEHSDRDWVIDRYGDDDEEYFLKMLNKNGIEYEIIDPRGPGGGWPIIEYTGTKEQLFHLFELMTPSGYSYEEIAEMLADWDGDENDPAFQEVMF